MVETSGNLQLCRKLLGLQIWTGGKVEDNDDVVVVVVGGGVVVVGGGGGGGWADFSNSWV